MANQVILRIVLTSVYFFTIGPSFFSNVALGHVGFGYNDDNGPDRWHEEYNTCLGKHQSPINILENHVETVQLPHLKFSDLEIGRPAYITNNGHTVVFRLNESEPAHISGGPLGDNTYTFEQLHFHWGEHDEEGSEDLLNNHSFAMELHAVFYKQAYGSFQEAINNSDGLAVLAYFFEASNDSNPTFDMIVNAVPHIEEVNAYQRLAEPLQLKALLTPDEIDVQSYFTYHGSLTTPPCLEIVTWIDFKDPLFLSHKQIATFRDIKSSEGDKLTRNFRPVQPLAGRTVYFNQLSKEELPPELPETDQGTSDKDDTPGSENETEEKDDKYSDEKENEPTTEKSDSENDIDGTFKEDQDEDLDTHYTTEESEEIQQNTTDGTSGKVQMIINIFITLSTLCTIFVMR